MIKINTWIVIISVIFVLVTGCVPTIEVDPLKPEQVDEILNIYEGFKSSIKSGNGIKAYSLLSKQTRDYYDNYVLWAKQFNKKELRKLRVADEILALTLRTNIPADVLTNLSGKDAFIYAVENRFVENTSPIKIKETEIGQIEYSIYKAGHIRGQILLNGKEYPYSFTFVKEFEEWKIDLVYIYNLHNAHQDWLKDKMSREKYITTILGNQ